MKGVQEKESIIGVRARQKNPSLAIWTQLFKANDIVS